jgi:hypothetical protein
MTSRIVSSAALGLLACLSAGCGKKEEKASPTEVPKEEPKAIALDAVELTKQLKTDPAKTNEEYKDKLVEVAGIVDSVDQTARADKGEITLRGFEPEGEPEMKVRCDLPNAALEKALTTLSEGQQVKVKGHYLPDPTNMRVYLTKCEVQEVTPSTLFKTSSVDLAKRYAAGTAAARKELGGKDLLVTGKVLDLKRDGVARVVLLEGSGTVAVQGRSPDEKAWADLNKGEEARIRGRFSPFSTEKEVHIDPAYVVPGK